MPYNRDSRDSQAQPVRRGLLPSVGVAGAGFGCPAGAGEQFVGHTVFGPALTPVGKIVSNTLSLALYVLASARAYRREVCARPSPEGRAAA